jgi:hypothetical protein
LNLEESDCDIKGCSFVGTEWSGVYFGAGGNATLTVDGCSFTDLPLSMPFYDRNVTVSITNCSFRGEVAYLALGAHPSVRDYSDISERVPTNGTVSGNVFEGEGASLVFHPVARASLLGENSFKDGARAYAFYTPEVLDEDHDRPYYGFITIDSVAFYRSIGEDWWTSYERFYHLVDVTEDPLADTDPGLVPSVIRQADYYYMEPTGPVVGYQVVPVAAPTVTLRNVEWPDPEWVVEEFERDFAIDDNWWKR